MKRILLVLIACVALCACDNGNSQVDRGAAGSSTSQSDSDTIVAKDIAAVEQKYAVLKESVRDNQSRTDSLVSSLKTVNDKLKNKVESQVVYVLLAICVLLLLLEIGCFFAIKKLYKSKDKLKYDLSNFESRILKLQKDISTTNNRGAGQTSHDYREDIEYLRRQIGSLQKSYVEHNENVKAEMPESPKTVKKEKSSGMNEKVGYMGVNDARGIIGKVYPSATEEAVFKYYANSDSIVDFEPLSLKRIKSISTIREAISIIEGSLQDAHDMIVVKRGQAVQREQNGQKYWQITLPAEVKLK